MGKAKPVKKQTASPLKISASLFQRKSKNSQNSALAEMALSLSTQSSASTKKQGTKGGKAQAAKAEPKSKTTTGKGNKGSSETVPATKKSNTTTTNTKQKLNAAGGKKGAKTPAKNQGKKKGGPKEKASGGKEKGAAVKAVKGKGDTSKATKGNKKSSGNSNESSSSGQNAKDREKSPPPEPKVTRKVLKSKSKSPSPLPRSTQADKVTTRKRSKSDSESPPPPSQKQTKGSKNSTNSRNTSPSSTSNKSRSASATSTSTSTPNAKNANKKTSASVATAKKKSSGAGASSKEKSSPAPTKNKTQQQTKSNNKKTTKPVGKVVKGKLKPKPKMKPTPKGKLKRMASLNAKAILEASFSFEPQEKKQRSPAPSSTPANTKVKTSDELSRLGDGRSDVKPITSISSAPVEEVSVKGTKTNDSSSSLPSPSSKTPVKVGSERKRKSSETPSRRESVTSGGNYNHIASSTSSSTDNSGGKSSSRRNSVAATSEKSTDSSTNTKITNKSSSSSSSKHSSTNKSPSPRKKPKVAAASTSTSTSSTGTSTSTATASTSTSTSTSTNWTSDSDAELQQQQSHHHHQQPNQHHHHHHRQKQSRIRVIDSSTQGSTVDRTGFPERKQESGEMETQTMSTSIGIGTEPVHREHHHHHHHHSHKNTSHSHSSNSSSTSVRQKSTGCQTKEKKSSTPVARYEESGGTVYQPAGPLIEPHKISSSNSMPAGILPESVRLPPDLKVTYQTHPPTSCVATTTSSSNSKASNTKHHQHHSHHHSSNSSKQPSTASISTSTHKSAAPEKASGAILHQPYKSSSTGTGTTPLPASQPNYGVSYTSGISSGASSNGSSTGNLMTSSSLSSSTAAAAAALLSQQHQASSGLTMTSHQHPLSSTGSMAAAAGAPSGMYYTAGFGPHHSPFTPCKYPIVPPDSYRAHSPYPNSYLYAPTTPQPSQSYFMTPFYTPPMTPTPAPVLGATQTRALLPSHSSAAAAAAAAAYYQTGPPPSAHHPSNYFVTSPPLQSHHSIQPTPAPGHAGLFRPNQSSQPACPCPTESCQPNSINNTNNNNKLLQQQSVSSASLPAPEAGAKQPLAFVSAATSASVRKDPSHPPICTTPAVAADPPKTIQLGPNSTGIDIAQAKQLESAKTFTEQYSLPDDITITPILVSNPSVSQLLNSPSITLSTTIVKKNSKNDFVNNSTFSVAPKQRDIVHVIDPRSGQTTTIAKHISNNNLVVSNMNSSISGRTATVPSHVTSVRPNNALHVGKLNPDLDVIVIGTGRKPGNLSAFNNMSTIVPNNMNTNNNSNSNNNSNRKISNVTNLKSPNNNTNTPTNKTNRKNNKQSGVGKRIALADNDNNRLIKMNSGGGGSNINSNNKRNVGLTFPTHIPNVNVTAMNLVQPLPPQITVSSPPNSFLAKNNNHKLNSNMNSTNNYNQIQNLSLKNNVASINSNQKSENAIKSNKRISLNECIDGLQRKKMRILESAGKVLNQNGNDFTAFSSSAFTPTNNKGVVNMSKPKAITTTAARVRDLDLDLNLSSTFIKSSDAVAAASALVVNPYPSRPLQPGFSLSPLKNGLRKGRFGQNVQLKKKSPAKMKRKRISEEEKISTRSSTANAKIRTRLSSKSKVPNELLPGEEQQSRSRSRLLRKRLTLGGGGSGRQSESDSSASRSSSAVRMRISTGGTNGKLTKESSGGCSSKDRPKNFYYYQHTSTPTSSHHGGGSGSSGCGVSSSSSNRNRNVILKVPRITGGRTASPIPSGSAQANYQYNLMNMERSGGGGSPHPNFLRLANEKPKTSLGWVPDSAYVGYGPFGQGHRIGTGNILASSTSSASSPLISSGVNSSASANDDEKETVSNNCNETNISSSGAVQGASRYATQTVGNMAISAMKKRAIVKPLSPTLVNGALQSMLLSRRQLKWSNGWMFEGEPYEAKVYLKNDDQHVVRICYPAMRHDGGDIIQARDCVLLKSGPRKTDLPFVAKVAALWENPLDGEMMFSLLWYYRPEHTDMGRTKDDMSNEIFASKHRDCNSVATIEDRCYVLTFNEYCRYKKRLKQLEEGIPNIPVVPLTNSSMINVNSAADIAVAVWNGISTEANKTLAPLPSKVSPEVVFFCRKVYDYRQKRMLKNPS